MGTRRTAPKTARKCALYVRISKDRANEVSTDVQRQTCRKYAADRGWKIVETFEDVGRSAFKAHVRRPAFERMVAAVEAGEVDTVIAYKLDRLARSVRDFANLAATLDDHDAEFVSVTESFDTTTPMGRAMVSIASVFAELESAVKSERIGDALAHRRAQGAPTNGPRPFGLSADRQKIDQAEARLIRQAAKRVLAGDSIRAIINDWNAKGLRTPKGSEWSRRGISYVLTSPTTAGLRDIDGVFVDGTMPAVLDRETWNEVGETLRDPARRTGGGNGRLHFLTGFASCECGTPLATKPHRAGWRYTCGPRKGYDACGGVSIDGAQTEGLIANAIAMALDGPRLRAASLRPTPGRDTLVDIDDDLEALAADFGTGRLTHREWHAARTALETRRAEAVETRATGRDVAAVKQLVGARDVTKAWEALDITARRAVIRVLVASVTIHGRASDYATGAARDRQKHDAGADRRIILADRIEIEWKV